MVVAENISRKGKNAWIGTVGFFQKCDKLAMMEHKKLLAKGAKKKFGVKYMTLVYQGASPADLENCVECFKAEIDGIVNDIDELKGKIDAVNADVESKLLLGEPTSLAGSGGTGEPRTNYVLEE